MARVHGGYALYGLGLIRSVKLESCGLIKPTLVIRANSLPSSQFDEPLIPSITLRAPPVRTLKALWQCALWIERNLKSMRLILVAAAPEGANPEVLLRDLVWKMKEKWEQGEMSAGVVEMDVIKLSETAAEFDRRNAMAWVKDMTWKFKGPKGSCTCMICLEFLVKKSRVVELPCRHVFHCECIREWFKKTVNCPCCRSPVKVSLGLWVHREEAALSDPLWSPYLIRCSE